LSFCASILALKIGLIKDFWKLFECQLLLVIYGVYRPVKSVVDPLQNPLIIMGIQKEIGFWKFEL
jgi:hypothetical protein